MKPWSVARQAPLSMGFPRHGISCLGQEDGKLSWVFLNSQRVYLPRGEGVPFVVGAQW